MSVLTQLLQNAVEREQNAVLERQAAEAEALQHRRQLLAGLLPVEVWQELGVDPHEAQNSSGLSGHPVSIVRESEVTIDGETVPVGVRAQHNGEAGLGSVYVSLHKTWSHYESDHVSTSLEIDHSPYRPRHLEVSTAERQRVQEQNALRVGNLVLEWLRAREAAKRDAYQRLVKRFGGLVRPSDDSAKIREKIAQIEAADDLREADRERILAEARRFLEVIEPRELERAARAVEERAQDRAIAGQVVEAANAWAGSWAAYHDLCEQWAAAETARLWRAWRGWLVRYMPVVLADNYDDESLAGPVEEALILDDPQLARRGEVVRIVSPSGGISYQVLGAFLDARLMEFCSPGVPEGLPYHRTFRAGGFVVSVPPLTTEDPKPAPEAPPEWHTFVDVIPVDEINDPSLRWRIHELRPGQLARATVDEVIAGRIRENGEDLPF